MLCHECKNVVIFTIYNSFPEVISKDQYSLLVVVLSCVQNMLQYMIFHLQFAPTFLAVILLLSYFFKSIIPTFVLVFVIVRWALCVM